MTIFVDALGMNMKCMFSLDLGETFISLSKLPSRFDIKYLNQL